MTSLLGSVTYSHGVIIARDTVVSFDANPAGIEAISLGFERKKKKEKDVIQLDFQLRISPTVDKNSLLAIFKKHITYYLYVNLRGSDPTGISGEIKGDVVNKLGLVAAINEAIGGLPEETRLKLTNIISQNSY